MFAAFRGIRLAPNMVAALSSLTSLTIFEPASAKIGHFRVYLGEHDGVHFGGTLPPALGTPKRSGALSQASKPLKTH